MNKFFGTLALSALLVAGAFAQAKSTPPAKGKPAAVCPVCHMALSPTKNKANSVAVRLKKGDKVMYCCAGCKMPKSMLVKEKGKGKGDASGKGKGEGKSDSKGK